jgi:hypothetical protein
MTAGTAEKVRRSLAISIVARYRLGRHTEYAALASAIAQIHYLYGDVIRLDGDIRLQPELPTAMANFSLPQAFPVDEDQGVRHHSLLVQSQEYA